MTLFSHQSHDRGLAPLTVKAWSAFLSFTLISVSLIACEDAQSGSEETAGSAGYSERSDRGIREDLSTPIGGENAGGEPVGAGEVGTVEGGSEGEELQQADHWCDAALGGPSGLRASPLDFASAHATLHLFGVRGAWMQVDEALSDLLIDESLFDSTLLDRYAELFEGVCPLESMSPPANSSPDIALATRIEQLDEVAWITPGRIDEPLAPLSEQTRRVIIDLRGIHPSAELTSAIALALGEDVMIGHRQVRHFSGLPSHDEGWTHYESSLVDRPLIIRGEANESRPLFFVTPSRLTPEVTTLVAGLYLSGHAGVIGYDVFTQIAESTWTGIGQRGVLTHTSTLHHEGTPWPDVITADLYTSSPERELDDLPDLMTRREQTTTPDVTREVMREYNRAVWDWETADIDLHTGVMRAGLIIAWGVLDRFFPYFDLVGRTLDDQLIESLEEVSAIAEGDRAAFMKTLGRFMHDLYDGHGFYSDWAGDWPSGYLIVQIQRVDGQAVVRSSMHEGIEAGDTIVEIDGIDAELWYEEAMSRYSAATEGYRFVLATHELKEVWGTRALRLRAPDGVERALIAEGRPWEDQDLVPWGGSRRPNGWLDDLGAPEVYYLNLSGDVTIDDETVYEEVVESIIALEDNNRLILDMRDYPAINYYELERYFHSTPYTTPQFWFPTWTGPQDFSLLEDSWSFTPLRPGWTGQIALLMSNKSVSSAENVGQMLEYLPNVTVVGQTSAGTNGTVTSFWLPGNISLTFTGMRLRNPDGSEFHGIGLIPDVEVTPTPQELASGVDPELMAAIEALE